MKVTKWSIFTGDLTVTEQSAEPISGESGSLSPTSPVPHSSEASIQPVVTGPDLVPGRDATAADAPKVEVPEADASKTDAPKAKQTPFPGKLLIMSAGEHNWDEKNAGPGIESEPGQGMFGKRRLAVAAMLALAVVAGALGGAMATAGLSHFAGSDVASADGHALEASIARIDADILALKTGVEHTSMLAVSQFSKTSDRLDKVEKAQAEPAAKLAKLSETVDKLRVTPPAAPPVPVAAAPAATKEVTGSVTPPAAAPAAAPKPEVGRLPTVEGWVLRDVGHGGALIEGRRGIFEVYAGDPIPGLGRVDAIRRQEGRWVVVTTKGLIVAR